MAHEPQSAVLEILKRIQADLSAVRSDVHGLKANVATLKSDMGDVKGRLERVETIVTKHRRESAGMLVMMRGTAGQFDERVSALETDRRTIKSDVAPR